MRIERLRPYPTPEQLAVWYATPHDHRIYGPGHAMRVEATVALAQRHVRSDAKVADLSCGNGEIARRIAPMNVPILGDLAPGYDVCGPIEETIDDLPQVVDVFVCSETIEHLDNPLIVLRSMRMLSRVLVLSTPIGCWNDTNGEHLFAWDREGVEFMLTGTRWALVDYAEVDTRTVGEGYVFGIWIAS